jgi:hypothetical protein
VLLLSVGVGVGSNDVRAARGRRHTCRHFFGLHLLGSTMAIRVNASSASFFLLILSDQAVDAYALLRLYKQSNEDRTNEYTEVVKDGVA